MKKNRFLLLLLPAAMALAGCQITIGGRNASSSVAEDETSSIGGGTVASDSSEEPIASDPGSEGSSSSPSSSSSSSSSTGTSASTDLKLLWSDEFEGTSLDINNWGYDTGTGTDGWGNWESQYYRAENATVSEGVLTITAKQESYGGMSYTSARIKTQGKFSFTYGRIEARMKLPGITGSWPAFWMLPVSDYQGRTWPWNGEIDIMENQGGDLYNYITTLHTGQESAEEWWSTQNSNTTTLSSPVTEWHVYGVEWTEDYFSFFCDDTVNYIVTKDRWQSWSAYGGTSAPFNQDFYIILNLAIGGSFIGYALPDASNMPCQMQVDYVRVYEI